MYKRRKLTHPKPPIGWTCIQSLVGPVCVPVHKSDNVDEPSTPIFKTEAECQASREFKSPCPSSEYAITQRDVLEVVWDYLDAETLGVLSSHDVKSKEILSDQLAIAEAAEHLRDTFFVVASIEYEDDLKYMSKFWKRFKRSIMNPRNAIEFESGQLAMRLIMSDIDEQTTKLTTNNDSMLLEWVRDCDEFVDFVCETWPDQSRVLMWYLTEANSYIICQMRHMLDFTDTRWIKTLNCEESTSLIHHMIDRNAFDADILKSFSVMFSGLDYCNSGKAAECLVRLALALITDKSNDGILQIANDLFDLRSELAENSHSDPHNRENANACLVISSLEGNESVQVDLLLSRVIEFLWVWCDEETCNHLSSCVNASQHPLKLTRAKIESLAQDESESESGSDYCHSSSEEEEDIE